MLARSPTSLCLFAVQEAQHAAQRGRHGGRAGQDGRLHQHLPAGSGGCGWVSRRDHLGSEQVGERLGPGLTHHCSCACCAPSRASRAHSSARCPRPHLDAVLLHVEQAGAGAVLPGTVDDLAVRIQHCRKRGSTGLELRAGRAGPAHSLRRPAAAPPGQPPRHPPACARQRASRAGTRAAASTAPQPPAHPTCARRGSGS